MTREEKEQLLAERLRATWWIRVQGWVLVDVAIVGALFLRHYNLFLALGIVGLGFIVAHRIRADRIRRELEL